MGLWGSDRGCGFSDNSIRFTPGWAQWPPPYSCVTLDVFLVTKMEIIISTSWWCLLIIQFLQFCSFPCPPVCLTNVRWLHFPDRQQKGDTCLCRRFCLVRTFNSYIQLFTFYAHIIHYTYIWTFYFEVITNLHEVSGIGPSPTSPSPRFPVAIVTFAVMGEELWAEGMCGVFVRQEASTFGPGCWFVECLLFRC